MKKAGRISRLLKRMMIRANLSVMIPFADDSSPDAGAFHLLVSMKI
jgi:hypothetical protein